MIPKNYAVAYATAMAPLTAEMIQQLPSGK